jgi:23S rRNA pseudouridine1911/1915/1917 synthase
VTGIPESKFKHYRFVVPVGEAGKRLDIFLLSQGLLPSRSQIRKLIKEGSTRIDGAPSKSGKLLKGGEIIEVEVEHRDHVMPASEPFDVEVPYEDDEIIVVNKPPSMPVHPGPGHKTGTLVNALLSRYRTLPVITDPNRPGIVHRLDKDTSGLMIVCKGYQAYFRVSKMVRNHEISRIYTAVVQGVPPHDAFTISVPIGRHLVDRKKISSKTKRGKAAVTHVKVMERFGAFSLLKVKLETGRTHQIRVHLSESGYPVVGDPVYGRKLNLERLDPRLADAIRVLNRQALHSTEIEFVHPSTGQIVRVESDLPADISLLVETLRSLKNA